MTTMINNINDLQADLVLMYQGLRDGTVKPKEAVEVNNTAGKIIGVSKVQLVYHALRKEAPNIPFLAAKVDGPAIPAANLKLVDKPAKNGKPKAY